MLNLTGLTAADWLVVTSASLAVALVVQSRRRIGGSRVAGFTVVPSVAGVLALAAIAALHPSTFERLARAAGRPWTLAGLVIGVALAFVVVDFVISRVLPLLPRGDRPPGGLEQIVFFATLAIAGVGILSLAVDRVDAVPRSEGTGTTSPRASTTTTAARVERTLPLGLTLVARHRLEGLPIGLAVDHDRGLGYMTLRDGRIVTFRLDQVASSSTLDLVTVATGLEYPRGMAVVGDELFVGELGRLPCAEPFVACKGEDVDEAMPALGEALMLEASRGRVTAFDIGPDGGLSGRRTILDELPVIATDHGVNDLVLGPDGLVYLSIGGFDKLTFDRELIENLDHPHLDWIGSVLRVVPDGSGAEVFASGLRNVFGLAFAPDGSLWGVDNDGLTQSGSWRLEEVLRIAEGDQFGFPVDGTFGEWQLRNRGPVWVTDTVGSAGLAWGDDVGLSSTLLMGSCARLQALELTPADDGWVVGSRDAYVDVMKTRGCVVGIVTVPPDLIIAVTFSGRMYVLRTPGVAG